MFEDLTIKKKLSIAFGTIILISLLSNIYAVFQLNQARTKTNDFYDNNYFVTHEALDLSKYILNVDSNVIFQYIDPLVYDYYDAIVLHMGIMDEKIDNIGAIVGNEHPNIIKLRYYMEVLRAAVLEIHLYDLVNDEENLERIMFDRTHDYHIAYYEIKTLATELADLSIIKAENINTEINDSATFALVVAISLLIVNVISTSIVNAKIFKSLIAPIEELEKVAEKIGKGDFSVDETYLTHDDELGHLSKELRTVTDKTNVVIQETAYVLGEFAKGNYQVETRAEYVGVFKNIKDSIYKIANDVNNSTSTFTDETLQLIEGLNYHPAALQKLSPTFAVMSKRIYETTENARQANLLAYEVGLKMEMNNKKMKEVVEHMNEVTKSNNEIVTLLRSIDDIAFQSNLVALQSALEVEYDKETSKQFKAVADQVRHIAKNSVVAAKDSSNLMTSLINSINAGNDLVAETASSLDEVYDLTNDTIGLINNISGKSLVQSKAFKEVGYGLEEMYRVIEENTITIEENIITIEEEDIIIDENDKIN
ncbi:MAG: hypothetical protein ATN35_08150 [Epulopiscium sp. Nele67-Bin004]|nr:MAG: hypothetical protein ATN35_08150 [Epulopiscium sp. Nele67-Bin004]